LPHVNNALPGKISFNNISLIAVLDNSTSFR
jgi:hypothetical protein